MKIKIIVLMAFLCGFTINIFAQNMITKMHKAEHIQSIAASGNVEIHVTQCKVTEVKVEATKEQHEAMKLNIKDGGLEVSYKNKGKEKPIKVHVSLMDLESLAASSGADIYFDNKLKTKKLSIALSSGSDFSGAFDVDELSCAASGGSDMDLKNSRTKVMRLATSGGSDLVAKDLVIGSCNIAISGGSDVNFSGTCDEMNLVASGSSDMSAENFIIKKCNLIVSGSSDVDIHVTEELSVNVSGSSDVNCKGNPTIKEKKVAKSSDFSM